MAREGFEAVIKDDGFIYFYDPGDREKNKTWVSREKAPSVVDLREFNRTLACFVQGWKGKIWIDETRKSVDQVSKDKNKLLGKDRGPFLNIPPLHTDPSPLKTSAREQEQHEVDKAVAKGNFRALINNLVSNKCLSMSEEGGAGYQKQFDQTIDSEDYEGARAVIKAVDDNVFDKGSRYW